MDGERIATKEWLFIAFIVFGKGGWLDDWVTG